MQKRKKRCLAVKIVVLMAFASFCAIGAFAGHAQETAQVGTEPATAEATKFLPPVDIPWGVPWAIAFSIGVSCIAAAYAVGKVGAAAMGAASERPELIGRALLFVALAEGIAIYGVLISILLWLKL